MPSGSRLDHVYRSILMTKFFTKGWGKPENLKRLFAFRKIVSNRESCFKLVPRDYPISIEKEETYSDCRILEGKFISPFVSHLPGLLPQESETAYFQVILPREWKSENYKPICLHLAGTGDHGFWRRRQIMAKPLLKSSGIASILLENPFYGLRKPKDQVRSSLHNVTDIFVMGGCLILESLALFHWCERSGFGPLGITGMSMGGHMASLAATNWPKPLVLVPCLSWSTASAVFTQGVMSGSINWNLLESQYFSEGIYRDEIKKMIIKDDAFQAGQHFAKHYPESMNRINELQNENKNTSTGAETKSEKSVKEDQNQNCQKSSVSFMSSGIGISSPKTAVHVNESEEMSGCKSPSVFQNNSEVFQMDKNNNNINLSSNTVINSEQRSNQSASNKTDTSGLLSSLNFNLLSQFTGSQLFGLQRNQSQTSVRTGTTSSGPDKKKLAKLQEREAFLFMRGIMDECTHLSNFEIPVDTSLIIAICAKDDAYVPREGCADLADIWPGAEVRFLDAGHVSAFLLGLPTFRGAIVESFERLQKKYHPD
ncbi:protein ABHD18 [Anabrus simplex]|uniref:protein ABHD18 n=1 Tax=Anabrus simplex TaxID=316456 RepID=UPI0034DD8BF9